MSNSELDPVQLTSAPNDLEAAMIVSTLAAHDLDATTSGEFTSGFRAEAPGDVQVLVRQCDLQKAQEVLDDLCLRKSTEASPSASSSAYADRSLAFWPPEVVVILVAGGFLLLGALFWLFG